MIHYGMPRFRWTQAVLAWSSFTLAQDSSSPPADSLGTTVYETSTTGSIASATVSGATSTYSIPFTGTCCSTGVWGHTGWTLPPRCLDTPELTHWTVCSTRICRYWSQYPPQHQRPGRQASTGQSPGDFSPINANLPQTLCPGYKAGNVEHTENGFKAVLSLAGTPCNVYGTDIETLALEVDVQSDHRLHVSIQPYYISDSNRTQYLLNEDLVPLPEKGEADSQDIDLQFSWSNEPSFSWAVVRKSTGDVLVDTTGSVLVYENQFVEFVSQLPEDYNLYGMGEQIRGLRLQNNFTATFYAADIGDPIDRNIYGVHPFYLDTRYFEVDEETGAHTSVTSEDATAHGDFVGYSHGVFLRNAHGMEALFHPTNITWRSLGGSIDLYIFDGPTQEAVTKQYQQGAIGLPAMQQYWAFGFHQCRWGYKNWSEVEAVVNSYRDFNIPLETVWYGLYCTPIHTLPLSLTHSHLHQRCLLTCTTF